MLQTRVIPCLLLENESLVKTVRFKNPGYIGDPINTVRIFNELEVDELIFLDITATKEGRKPNFKILQEISNECFMPLAYGGGIRTIEDAQKIFTIGFEKVAINSFAMENPEFVTKLADVYGNQAIIGSIDVKKNIWGKPVVVVQSGTKKTKISPVDWAKKLEDYGAGEILITSIEHEGTWSGYNIELTQQIAEAVNIPVIAHGGAGSIEHIEKVVKEGNASAVAVGSMVVYQSQGMGVLVNFPDRSKLEKAIN